MSERTTGATTQQIESAARDKQESGNSLSTAWRWEEVPHAHDDLIYEMRKHAAYLIPPDKCIIGRADLKKLRANLTPAFEHDDQACLVKIDALIRGDS